jgi:ion channel
LYFSIVTFTTLGSGDLLPHDDVAARLLVALEDRPGPAA